MTTLSSVVRGGDTQGAVHLTLPRDQDPGPSRHFLSQIAQLLDDNDRLRLTPDEVAAREEELYRLVLTIWQTSILRRRSKLAGTVRVAVNLSAAQFRNSDIVAVAGAVPQEHEGGHGTDRDRGVDQEGGGHRVRHRQRVGRAGERDRAGQQGAHPDG